MIYIFSFWEENILERWARVEAGKMGRKLLPGEPYNYI